MSRARLRRAAARLKLGDCLGALEDSDAALRLDARYTQGIRRLGPTHLSYKLNRSCQSSFLPLQ